VSLLTELIMILELFIGMMKDGSGHMEYDFFLQC